METSDSDYFESADEDIFSDEENNPSVLERQSSATVVTKKEGLASAELSNERSVQSDLKNLNININSQNGPHDGSNDKGSTQSELSNVKSETSLVAESKQSVQNEILDNVNPHTDYSQNSNDIVSSVEPILNNVEKEDDSSIPKDAKEQIVETVDTQKKHEISEDVNSNLDEKSGICAHDMTDLETSQDRKSESEAVDDSWNNDGWDIDDDLDDGENLWTKDEACWKDNDSIVGENKNNVQGSAKLIDSNVEEIGSNRQLENNSSLERKVTEDNSRIEKSANDGWGGWGGWGVTSILSTATQGVSALTSQVSQGLSTALETGIGIPNPEDLAKQHVRASKNDNVSDDHDNEDRNSGVSTTTFGFGLSNLVSGVSNITKFVESTGTKVVSGGLDTLETIGKKTMEVLQEGDPGLKKKRSFLQLEPTKPVLSQVLKEAKLKAEQEEIKTIQEKQLPKKNYERVFDDYHGLVHLEALEMLSKQCEIKLQMLQENCDVNSLTEIQETLEQVRELCELPDDDDEEQLSLADLKEKLSTAVGDLNVNVSYSKLVSSWEDTEGWLNNIKLNVCDEKEIHEQAIETLAQLTAIAVEQYHKAGELLLIKDHRSTADEADSLVQLTVTLTSLIGIVAGKFSEKLNMKVSNLSSKEEVNSLITNVFFEAANSSSYIQDAFQLLIPVLQVGAV